MEKIKKTTKDLKDEGLLLKLSGEVFLHTQVLDGILHEIVGLAGKVGFAVLLGGGNHVRGAHTGKSGQARIFLIEWE